MSVFVVASAVTKMSFGFWRCGSGRPRASSGTGGAGYSLSSAAARSVAFAALSGMTNVSRVGAAPVSPERLSSLTKLRMSSNTDGCAVTMSVLVVASASMRTGLRRRSSGARSS